MARRSALFVAVLALAVAGLHAYGLLPRRLEPAVPSNVGLVEARLPGVSAAELERVLTEPVEAALLRLPDVIDCRSETRDGVVLLAVECVESAVRSGAAWASVEDQLARQREDLSDGFVGLQGPELHRPSEQMVAALISVSFAGSGSVADGAEAMPPIALARKLSIALGAARSVDHVELLGRPHEQIVLGYDDADLSGAGMTPWKFREYLRAQHITAPGAYLHHSGSILPIETVSRIPDFASLQELPVRDPADGDPVNLSRLLDVSREPVRPIVDRVEARGRPAVALAIYRSVETDLESFAREVRAGIERFGDEHAVECELVVFQPAVVAEEIDRFGVNLIQAFVAILILLVLALGLRAGLSVAVALPLVVLSSFIVLYAGGFGLDIVTLSSFILVLGLIVDNHIVMAERVHRLKELGLEQGAALSRSRRELFGPLVAAAATTVFGFLPIVLTDHVIGDYVSSMFWVVLITLAISLIYCYVVTPQLLSRGPERPAQRVSELETIYKRVVKRGFDLAIPMVLLVIGLCFGGQQLLSSADKVFFPASSRPLWLLEVELAHGTQAERTQLVTRDLDELLAREVEQPDAALRHWVTFLGRSAPPIQVSIPQRRFAPHYAQVLLRLDPARDATGLEQRLRAWMTEHADSARLRLRPVRLGAQLEWPIQVELRGPRAEIEAVSQQVVARLVEQGCPNVSTDWGDRVTKLKVEPDRAALSDRDLTVADLTLGMHSVLHGLPLFDLIEDDIRTPVMLRAKGSRSNPREALSDAYVYPEKGDPSLLYEVASLRERQEYPVRARRRGEPCLTVRADSVNPDHAMVAELEVDDWLDGLRAEHPGLTIEVTGLSEISGRANRALLDGMPWALLLMLLCLLAQSRSLIDTGLILLTIPLSFTGVAFGLWVTGQPFSFMTLVGMTALAGIVVNNAIVLLASIRHRLEETGSYSQEALIDSAAHRLRPILLTTLCALASMTVLYTSGGPMWQPLATAVISGLLFSTLLVLFVLPVLYGRALSAGAVGKRSSGT
jgi:multidrug efflux pump subunit AcrB